MFTVQVGLQNNNDKTIEIAAQTIFYLFWHLKWLTVGTLVQRYRKSTRPLHASILAEHSNKQNWRC